MIMLLKLISLTTIWCLGIKILTSEGMLLDKLGKYAHKKVDEGKIIFDPLLACEFCLPSIHSLVGYSFAISLGIITHFSWSLIFIYPLVAMGSSIGCGFIWNAYLTMQVIKYKNEIEAESILYEPEGEDLLVGIHENVN